MTGSALRLHARESIGSWFEQSLVARRQEHLKLPCRNHGCFEPSNFQQTAGLVHYYNRHKFHFLAVTWHEELGRALTILSCPGDWPTASWSFRSQNRWRCREMTRLSWPWR
jgi:xylan 1,4-beta-xylosidase